MFKKKILGICLIIVLGMSIFPIYSHASDVLYQGYSEIIAVNDEFPPMHTGIRIKDGKGFDGNDNIAYCYNLEKSYPTGQNATFEGNDDRCFYSRIENYLETDDPYINKYGKDKKQKIALALYVGYPNDAYGDYERNFKNIITPDEARYMTQNLLWDITNNRLGDYVPDSSFSKNMCDYYNALYNNYIKDFKEGTVFFPGKPQIEGNMNMHKTEHGWATGPLSLTGIKGAYCEIELITSDPNLNVYHYSSKKPVTDTHPLPAGDEFFLSTTNDPKNSSIGLDWSCESAKFYFYEHKKGGKNVTGKEGNVQNLIRVQPNLDTGIDWFKWDTQCNTDRFSDEMIDITLEKKWEDAPPENTESINIWILADGERMICCELNQKNNWKATITLPKFYINGNIISYSVEESPVPDGYKSLVTGDSQSGFIITNSKIITDNSGSIDITEDTMPGESGSVADGSIIETEENSGSVDITEDTMPGESGSIPDGSIIETEENSNKTEIEEDTKPNKADPPKDMTARTSESTETNELDETPNTGNISRVKLLMFLSIASLCGAALL